MISKTVFFFVAVCLCFILPTVFVCYDHYYDFSKKISTSAERWKRCSIDGEIMRLFPEQCASAYIVMTEDPITMAIRMTLLDIMDLVVSFFTSYTIMLILLVMVMIVMIYVFVFIGKSAKSIFKKGRKSTNGNNNKGSTSQINRYIGYSTNNVKTHDVRLRKGDSSDFHSSDNIKIEEIEGV